MVYVETGRFPSYVLSYTPCFKYWLFAAFTRGLQHVFTSTYQWQILLGITGAQALYKFGFWFVWENPCVQNPDICIKVCRPFGFVGENPCVQNPETCIKVRQPFWVCRGESMCAKSRHTHQGMSAIWVCRGESMCAKSKHLHQGMSARVPGLVFYTARHGSKILTKILIFFFLHCVSCEKPLVKNTKKNPTPMSY